MRDAAEANMREDDRMTSLEALDPGHERPGYWDDYRSRIMDRVAFELARRRAAARESVAAVLSGWSRSLIPAAVAAAAIAAVLVGTEARRSSEPPPQLVMQDMLGESADDGAFEILLSADRTGNAGAFMALVEGSRP